MNEILLALTEQTTYRLRKYQKLATVISVQIKTNEFKVYSHQKKLEEPENTTKYVYEVAKELLRQLYQGQPVRLIGIRIEKLCNEEEIQLSLFENKKNEKQEKLDQVVDKLKDKYGYEKITRAGNIQLNNKITRKE